MDFKGLRVAYTPYSENLSAAGDRRRFCHYANRRGLAFEIAHPAEHYDVVLLTSRANPNVWKRYDYHGAKVILEMVDGYLAPHSNRTLKRRNFLKGITEGTLDYQGALRALCQRADAVICASEQQRIHIEPYCKNVHVILDFHSTVATKFKSDFSAGRVFNFIWEGLAFNIEFFKELERTLEKISSSREIAIHAVTDLEFVKYRYLKYQTRDAVRKIFGRTSDRVYLYQWNEQLLPSIVCACDLALIPIPLDDPFLSAKSENKLLLFWRMSMPTLTSATQAYDNAMRECGLSMSCRTTEEWEGALGQYMEDESARRHAGNRGRAFTLERHSEASIMERWDSVLASVLT